MATNCCSLVSEHEPDRRCVGVLAGRTSLVHTPLRTTVSDVWHEADDAPSMDYSLPLYRGDAGCDRRATSRRRETMSAFARRTAGRTAVLRRLKSHRILEDASGPRAGRRSFGEAQAQRRWLDELVELDLTRVSPLPHVDCTDSRKAGYGDHE